MRFAGRNLIMRLSSLTLVLAVALPLTVGARAQSAAPGDTDAAMTRVVGRIIAQEHAFSERIVKYQPRVETYIQNLTRDADLTARPAGDDYFLGYMDLSHGLREPMFTKTESGIFSKVTGIFRTRYNPLGFVQMIMPDRYRFNDTYYSFDFQGRDFLGDVRCLMFDVAPKKGYAHGSFKGRIWVEDQGYNIVRFDGTFVPDKMTHHFFHFDSWRMEMGPGYWLPAQIYTEEGELNKTLVKAETRFWGYDLAAARHSELTDVEVDSTAPVDDQSQTSHDKMPLTRERDWERKAEDDVLVRMQKAGLLSPEGEVDKVLDTVLNNLEVTNNLNIQPPVRARVMLTTPMESFTVGHTIVVSRGLIDVLPDEPSLAMILAHELGHIVLNQGIDTKYAFDDRMIFPDQQLFHQIQMLRTPAEEAAADQKGLDLLEKSPYASQLGQAGLFLLALSHQAEGMPNLVSAHMGNSMVLHGRLDRMQALIARAPQLQPRNPKQEPADALGTHIRLDPWTDQITLVKAAAPPIISARDKLSFEITPVELYLTRIPADGAAAAVTAKGGSPK